MMTLKKKNEKKIKKPPWEKKNKENDCCYVYNYNRSTAYSCAEITKTPFVCRLTMKQKL